MPVGRAVSWDQLRPLQAHSHLTAVPHTPIPGSSPGFLGACLAISASSEQEQREKGSHKEQNWVSPHPHPCGMYDLTTVAWMAGGASPCHPLSLVPSETQRDLGEAHPGLPFPGIENALGTQPSVPSLLHTLPAGTPRGHCAPSQLQAQLKGAPAAIATMPCLQDCPCHGFLALASVMKTLD